MGGPASAPASSFLLTGAPESSTGLHHPHQRSGLSSWFPASVLATAHLGNEPAAKEEDEAERETSPNKLVPTKQGNRKLRSKHQKEPSQPSNPWLDSCFCTLPNRFGYKFRRIKGNRLVLYPSLPVLHTEYLLYQKLPWKPHLGELRRR